MDYLVSLEEGANLKTVTTALKNCGVTVVQEMPLMGMLRVRLEEEDVEVVAEIAGVNDVEPNKDGHRPNSDTA